jgi:RNA recognition motif-containing protein
MIYLCAVCVYVCELRLLLFGVKFKLSVTLTGSIWSMESSDSLLNTTASSFSEPWRATSNSSRKPSLPLKLNAPTHYILIKNISAQIDETSLREVCSEYGKVMTCLFNPFNETALIQYSTRDEVALAKVGLERNPSICGVYVQPHYATEHDIAMFTDRRTPSNPSLALSSALNMSGAPGPWFNDQSHRPHKPPAASLWGSNDDVAIGNTHSNNGGSSGSVWSNGGTTLPGIVSPWNVPRPSQPHHQDRDDSNAISTSPPLSTFLPNGLF